VQSEANSNFGDFTGIIGQLGSGLNFDYVSEILTNSVDQFSHNAFKRQILTSFYLPGFILDLGHSNTCRIDGNCGNSDFPNRMRAITSVFNSCTPLSLSEQGAVKGYVPIYSNWMTSHSINSDSITSSNVEKWQEIGFVLYNSDLITKYLFIYSPTMAIKNGIWNLDEINLNSFFSNVSRIPGRFNNNTNIIDWAWTVRQWTNNTSWEPYPTETCTDDTWDGIKNFSSTPVPPFIISGNIKLNQKALLDSVVGIHLPDYSSPYSPAGTDDAGFSNACSIPKTVMRVI